MERYNLSVPRKYTSNGEEKTAWDPVGVMFKRDKGGYSLKLSMFPELSIFAFPPSEKDRSQRNGEDWSPPESNRKQESDTGDGAGDEIPF